MRNVELNLESGDQLDVRHFNVLDSVSAAFRIDIIARAADDAIHLSKIIGKPASFKLDAGHGARTWTGVVAHIAQTQVEPEGLSTYAVQLVPKMWLLSHRKNHRLFQHMSIPDMVKKILGEWGVQYVAKLTHSHPKLPMRTQYGETDFDFVRRLLAEAGISFFFHGADGEETKVVLADEPQSVEAKTELPFHRDDSLSGGVPHVTNVVVSSKVTPAKVTSRDYDFRRPRYSLSGSHTTEGGAHPLLEDYHFAPGHSLVDAGGSGEAVADKDGGYRHHDDAAAARAKRHAEAHKAHGTHVGFDTSMADLGAGSVFAMTGHPHPEVQGKKLFVTHSWLNGDVSSEWHGGGQAVPADLPYRPSVDHAPAHGAPATGGDLPFQPLKHLGKPRIFGVQSAIVTGPPGEDIHTDEHGRVKLQFPWDREGKFDDKSSPWVRVSQAWAGAGFGNMSIPRVGQEVLVGYHDGDPDHPVVVGRMHNSTAPVPYALPEHKTRTSLKSNSAAGANELTMEDKHDNELFYIQAQKDLHKIVKNDELEHTHGNRHVHVDGDLVLSAKGRVIIHSGDDLVVKGGPNVKINPAEKPKEAKKPQALSSQQPKKDAKSSDPNAALKKMPLPNLPASKQHAAAQKALAEKYKADAIKLGKKHHVPPALILGLMSRESDFGTALDANGRGDHGHGYGILQVDDRTIKHPAGGPYSYEHLDQAMGIFDGKLGEVKAAHPGWTHEQQLAGAVAAYNSGAGNIHTQPSSAGSWAAMDEGTTGNDYSRDTWARSEWFANNLDW